MILDLPRTLVTYCRLHRVSPERVAQMLLDHHGRECATLLLKRARRKPCARRLKK